MMAQKDQTLFQYFASIEGAMRLYPAQYWTEQYDARFASWYVQVQFPLHCRSLQ
jgi:hypothetical protein